MKRILLFAAVFFCFNLFSQNQIDQVFVLNEGYFDYSLNQTVEPVCIGVYDPATANYTTIDTIFGARFASDLIVDDGYFYVAASLMYMYLILHRSFPSIPFHLHILIYYNYHDFQ